MSVPLVINFNLWVSLQLTASLFYSGTQFGLWYIVQELCTLVIICCVCCSSVPIMMTTSNRNIFRVTGPLCGEITGPGEFSTQRPVTRNFDVFFHLRLNKRLRKQPWGWWFETPSWSLWRQCNVDFTYIPQGARIWNQHLDAGIKWLLFRWRHSQNNFD